MVLTLDHSRPRGLGVAERRLSAETDDLLVLDERSNEVVERVGIDDGISVDHEQVLEEEGSSASDQEEEED